MYLEQISSNISGISLIFKKMLATLQRPLWVDPNTSRVKADIGTCTTVTTVTTTTNLTQFAGFDIKQTFMYSTDRNTWAQAIRTRIHS